MSQDQEANNADNQKYQRYHHNLRVFAKPEIHYKTHKLMKGIWKDNFISPIKQELTEGKDFKVLDVGCGSGMWISQLSEDYPLAKFIGLDLFPIFPKEYSQKNLQFIQSDILKGLPFEDNSFDFVHMRMLLMAFTQIQLEEIVIKELIRVCKPGGWIEIPDLDVDGKSMGPTFKRLLTFSMKYLEFRGINGLISDELPSILEDTDQVNTVCSDEVYSAIGNWGGETGELAAEIFIKIIHNLQDLPKWVGISEEERELMDKSIYGRNETLSILFYFSENLLSEKKIIDAAQNLLIQPIAIGFSVSLHRYVLRLLRVSHYF